MLVWLMTDEIWAFVSASSLLNGIDRVASSRARTVAERNGLTAITLAGWQSNSSKSAHAAGQARAAWPDLDPKSGRAHPARATRSTICGDFDMVPPQPISPICPAAVLVLRQCFQRVRSKVSILGIF